jgi:hypothetical protein
VTTDRACRRGGICSDGEFVGYQLIHTLAIHDEHDQVDLFKAELQPEATALNRNEQGRGPTMIRLTAHYLAFSVLAAYADPAFLQTRNYDNAGCLIE